MSGSGHADEALHLAAAFGFTGARNVIGTLWSVGDSSSMQVAAQVYRRLADRGGDTAVLAMAVDAAMRSLRGECGTNDVLRWAAYIQYGP
ncbi:CHAT domain-containing protein [Catellatospora citrea]|uniref:CHAT domain-containing protein n=1 Tax=Catellatospora citrea TaxID=53366 RepID=UPI000FF399B6|nr:CHAT domain-containing protein [Catellatospora citrea]